MTMDFYVDQHGLKIPLSSNFTARVLVANGYIDELFTNHVDSLHTQLAKDCIKQPILSARIRYGMRR
jgi:cell division protein FtsQ